MSLEKGAAEQSPSVLSFVCRLPDGVPPPSLSLSQFTSTADINTHVLCSRREPGFNQMREPGEQPSAFAFSSGLSALSVART